MITDEIRTRYRDNRARYDNMPASAALHYARVGEPEDRFGLTWTGWTETFDHSVTLKGAGRVGEFEVRVTVTPDTDPIIDGAFTDTYTGGAVQNPAWRPGERNTLRWYVGTVGVEEHRRGLSKLGYDRHRAYTQAVAYVREDAKRDADPELYIIRARVLSNGVSLGESTLHGVDVPETWNEARRQLIDAANGQIEEAIGEGRARLAKLTASLPKRAGMRISVNDSYANTHEMVDGLRAIADLLAGGYTSGVWPHNFDLTGEPSDDL